MSADKIVILSDGTGNAASSVWRTNVWRVFQALDLRSNKQAAKYDDGVGTSSFVPLAILGGVFGWGLKRNVLDAYKFICRNYDSVAPSQIYLFGFSRGAFTARVLAALVLDQGLVIADTEAELNNGAVKAYRAYRAKGYHSIWRIEVIFRAIRDYVLVPIADRFGGRKSYSEIKYTSVPSIEFIGLWDTVAAYGLPLDEMTRGISNWVWPLELPNRVLSPKVKFARHALALDDERTTFHPVLWTEQVAGEPAPKVPTTVSAERLVQAWFVGMHANVGGGYPDDALAYVPLFWLVKEAQKHGLTFKEAPFADPDAVRAIESSQDKDGRLYDSRAGVGAYYRYGPRKVEDLCNDPSVGVSVPMPMIHESVFGRIDSGANAYAPIGLPSNYVILRSDGTVERLGDNTFETPAQAVARHARQERLWNYVWMRRLAYFATLAASFHLAAFWLFHDRQPAHEFASRFRLVSETVRFIESFLPRSFHWWTDWYAANPEWFLGGIALVALFIGIGSMLSGWITDGMRVVWHSRGGQAAVPPGFGHDVIYWFRNLWIYRSIIWLGKRHVLPLLLALLTVWIAATALSHLLFNIADSAGAFCNGTAPSSPPEQRPKPVNLGVPQQANDFSTDALCAPTGLTLRAGHDYEIMITIDMPWADSSITTTPLGFRTSSLDGTQQWAFRSAILLRRVLFRPWFRLIARIGETGVDEHFLDPIRMKGSEPSQYRAKLTAARDGELFLYVNDAVVGLPWIHSIFYGPNNNRGTAKVTVKLL
ncbi:DUF2235 domain-containing protein [Tardiphaga sp. P9-11]|uniref:DUF2235 domain-containing protein n=1 Tax=Tardiphaga sp. P9-11 TaxID=2024614 RepID=UPI0011F359F3|nr:DUF2235 domain-containing protein [Tardiphaga sp. P9-11]KAA0069964.1 DUF2235 domain-containing protein [Tardiphaga sp. P9-11]